MLGRLAVVGIAIVLLLAVPARAEQRFDLGFLKLGMPLAELRAEAWPPDTKLLCGTDEKLPEIDAEARKTISLRPEAKAAGVVPCALFGKDGDGVWRPRPITLGGNPSGFWAMAVMGDNGAPPVLAEVQLRQAPEFFADTLGLLSGRFGPAGESNKFAAHWITPAVEVTVAHESSGGVLTFLIDNRLYQLVKGRLGQPAVPAASHGGKAHGTKEY